MIMLTRFERHRDFGLYFARNRISEQNVLHENVLKFLGTLIDFGLKAVFLRFLVVHFYLLGCCYFLFVIDGWSTALMKIFVR